MCCLIHMRTLMYNVFWVSPVLGTDPAMASARSAQGAKRSTVMDRGDQL